MSSNSREEELLRELRTLSARQSVIVSELLRVHPEGQLERRESGVVFVHTADGQKREVDLAIRGTGIPACGSGSVTPLIT